MNDDGMSFKFFSRSNSAKQNAKVGLFWMCVVGFAIPFWLDWDEGLGDI